MANLWKSDYDWWEGAKIAIEGKAYSVSAWWYFTLLIFFPHSLNPSNHSVVSDLKNPPCALKGHRDYSEFKTIYASVIAGLHAESTTQITRIFMCQLPRVCSYQFSDTQHQVPTTNQPVYGAAVAG